MKNKIELMGHIIAGYPNDCVSLKAGVGILQGGANYLEVQFPFSDGNADGILIQNASDYSIKHGFNLKHGFTILTQLCKTSKHILVMTYANIIINYGVAEFIDSLKSAGVYGLIVPDFCFGECDFNTRKLCKENGIYFIELVAPLTPIKRVREIVLETNAPFIYVVARNGITGAKTQIDSEVLDYIENINEVARLESKEIMVGFGINDFTQVSSLIGKCYGVVAGSYFVNMINKNLDSKDITKELQFATQKLLGNKLEAESTNGVLEIDI